MAEELTPIAYDDFERVKTDLLAELDDYTVLTTDDIKEAKHIRIELNKLTKQVNDRKKEYKAPYVAATKPMEEQAKELMAMIEQAKKPVDTLIKSKESDELGIRQKMLNDQIAQLAYPRQIDPTQVEIQSKWLNKTNYNYNGITLNLKREISEELDLMVRYDKGTLPDGVNYQKGKLVNDDGEVVIRRVLTAFVDDTNMDVTTDYLTMVGIPYKLGKVGG